jgi:hypothetical protein
MESSEEPIRLDLVSRTITLGLAVVATGVIFTSVAVAFTAGAAGAAPPDTYVAQVPATLPGG